MQSRGPGNTHREVTYLQLGSRGCVFINFRIAQNKLYYAQFYTEFYLYTVLPIFSMIAILLFSLLRCDDD